MKKVFNKFAYIRKHRKDVIEYYKNEGKEMPKGADRLDAPTFSHISRMHGHTKDEIISMFDQLSYEANAEEFMQKEEVVFRGQKRPESLDLTKQAKRKEKPASGVPANNPFAELLKDYKIKK